MVWRLEGLEAWMFGGVPGKIPNAQTQFSHLPLEPGFIPKPIQTTH